MASKKIKMTSKTLSGKDLKAIQGSIGASQMTQGGQQAVIDPVNRIEGHLRIDMQVENGKVADAWVSGTLFRGMELVLENKEPTDAAYIAQRICGVCPVSHAHAACFAGERAYGIQIPNGARIIRNLVEGAQFLHSNILWFYNLNALDYVNPLDALKANPGDAVDLAKAAGTEVSDFKAVQSRLQNFADNGQLSIFSGNWFDSKDNDYALPPELNLIATAHYLEALEMQAVSSEISGIIGGKMPHIMSSVPGGTTFMPTEDKLADIKYRINRLHDWVQNTMVPDAYAIAPYYLKTAGTYGKGAGRYVAWGVFDTAGREMAGRYLPGGVLEDDLKTLSDPDETKITETTARAFYSDDGTPVNPRQGITQPDGSQAGMTSESEFGHREGKYTWTKAPRYGGKPYEATALSRMLVAYTRAATSNYDPTVSTNSAYQKGLASIKTNIDKMLAHLSKSAGKTLGVSALQSVLGRWAARAVETLYITERMQDWVDELIEAIREGDSSTFVKPNRYDGEGAGMWEAPRGALYHYEKVVGNKIQKYQIIIPSTWNVSPRDQSGVRGPLEQALIGVPVADLKKPLHALRTVHSFDPCVACAIHIAEPRSGQTFDTITTPFGGR
ncbi:MAG: nickel-dependent hydrogenase large subunit [Coriobacteriales bacterium]|jgi:hydrogenase large subunit|nr:nickel-dependent hydrogenase large subunit [Coriobacteriales bacterium]